MKVKVATSTLRTIRKLGLDEAAKYNVDLQNALLIPLLHVSASAFWTLLVPISSRLTARLSFPSRAVRNSSELKCSRSQLPVGDAAVYTVEQRGVRRR